MRTQDFPQTQRPDKNTDQSPGREDGDSTRHSHWDELHGSQNGSRARHLLTSFRHEVARRPWTDIAIAAAAGFAAGWLMSRRERSHALRDIFIGSLLPAASKKVHHAYDALRDNGTVRELGQQFDKLKSRW